MTRPPGEIRSVFSVSTHAGSVAVHPGVAYGHGPLDDPAAGELYLYNTVILYSCQVKSSPAGKNVSGVVDERKGESGAWMRVARGSERRIDQGKEMTDRVRSGQMSLAGGNETESKRGMSGRALR